MLKWNAKGIAAAVTQLSARRILFLPPVALIISYTAIAENKPSIRGSTKECKNTKQGTRMTIIARIAVIILVFIKNNLSFTTTNSGTEKSSADFKSVIHRRSDGFCFHKH